MAVRTALAVLLSLMVCHHGYAEAGPGQEEDGRPVDDAYMEHVQSIFSAIMEDDGQAGADFNDLNPQPVDVHTILPRIPAMKIGMNAMGHKMLHVHSDDRGEQDRYSSEILSSGLTAGFSLTDRVKGMQKGDGKPGTQWLMYSLSQMFRLKDEGTGDILTVKDGSLTLLGNKGQNAEKPRLTIVGGASSVPRLTLVSKTGGVSSFVSLYNRYGKFGLFSGPSDQSIFHVTADGSEMALVSNNVQPHILVQSNAQASTQELRLRGKTSQINIFHKSGEFGICKTQTTANAKCKSFLQVTAGGQDWNFVSPTDRIGLKLSHTIKGGDANIELVSMNKVGTLTSTKIVNQDASLTVRTQVGDDSKDVFQVTKDGDGTFFGKLDVMKQTTHHSNIHVKGDIFVSGEVTMSGGNGQVQTLKDVFAKVQNLEHENQELRTSRDELLRDVSDMQNDLRSAEVERDTMRNQMHSMLQTLQMVKEMQELSMK